MVSKSGTADIVAFPPRPMEWQRFSVRDRIGIVNCQARLQPLGIMRADLHTTDDHGDPDVGDFLLFYAEGQAWARWGIGCCGRGYLLWRCGNGESRGYFDTLEEALRALASEAAESLPAPAPAMQRPEIAQDRQKRFTSR